MKIPKGKERSGLKIKCLKCTNHVNKICPMTGKAIVTCKFKDRHRFNAVLHVPGTSNRRVMKLLDVKTFEEALIERAKFKVEMIKRNYDKMLVKESTNKHTTLYALTVEYLNTISGMNPLEILNRVRSKGHISFTKLVLMRFSKCIYAEGFSPKILDVKDIGDGGANAFLLFLRRTNSENSINKHFVIMKAFFNWIIEVKEYKISNPFRKAELRVETDRRAEVISKEEFENLLKVVTVENGWAQFKKPSTKQKGKNLYREYLCPSFKLALETGCRAEELVTLKWSDLRTVGEGVELFDITNLKVTRILDGRSKKAYKRPIPITRSLKALLMELGYGYRNGSQDYVIPRPKGVSEGYMTKLIGRAFNHYIKFVDTGGRKIEFKDLRKTYITCLTIALGSNAKLFTGHADDRILQDHYLSKQMIAANLTEFSVFTDEASMGTRR